MDRYVAIDKRHGQAVIDLLTGKMHMCEFDHPKDLILPLMGNGPKIVLRPSMRWFSHVLKRLCQLVNLRHQLELVVCSVAPSSLQRPPVLDLCPN
jgi:hypothetical protein